tara:strand:- start:293 stop:487 length:195 start_codon:yes stop_codon:yes gene_type:complete
MVEGFLDYNNGVFVFIKNNTETIVSAEQAHNFYIGSVECSTSVLDYFEEVEFEGYLAHTLRDEL